MCVCTRARAWPGEQDLIYQLLGGIPATPVTSTACKDNGECLTSIYLYIHIYIYVYVYVYIHIHIYIVCYCKTVESNANCGVQAGAGAVGGHLPPHVQSEAEAAVFAVFANCFCRICKLYT